MFRRPLPLIVSAFAALTLSACGGEQEPAGPPPTPMYAIPSQTPTPGATAASAAADPTTVRTGEDTPAARDAFVRGMEDYCTSYYTLAVKAEDAHPRPDLRSQVQFARAMAKSASLTEHRLERLRPPPDLASAFAQFVEHTARITTARAAMAESLETTGEEGPDGIVLDEQTEARRPLARTLQAPVCDGRLPPAQREAVVSALRHFETTSDSAEACGEDATPGFLQTRFFDYEDPLAGCVATRDFTANSGVGLATDIKVREVTGSDGIAAKVSYSLVGGCACGDDAVARLHMVDGRWLVSELGY